MTQETLIQVERKQIQGWLRTLANCHSNLFLKDYVGHINQSVAEIEEALSSPNGEPQRDSSATPLTWVGLTDETLDDVYFCVEGSATPLETWREQARIIEAKLKAKNERLEKNT